MRDTSLFFFLLVFCFVIVSTWLHRRSKEREMRMKLLEKALDKPGLDEATRRELTAHLAGRSFFTKLLRGEDFAGLGVRHWLLIAGWLGIFIAIGMMAVGGRHEEEAGIVTLLISIGVITLPFALREFERRRPA